ncbi:gamma-glutamyltranspeptidase [Nitzschia inconspicua]|uniref:Gamma-glutamyltranspeptidase n=1 Tax=Nitzschia inconspicua TaxID=303405 RepID=A0A9K3M4Y7_9STRA|nr:gamma-glutamyltranspeptidase [Nitzschia inconspicua]
MTDWFASPKGATKVQLVDEIPFVSRRSPVLCRNGCVASSQPLASSIGVDLLKQGANAAEAAIAVAAALNVTEPCSCGLGGDMFCLYYDASKREVFAINGSGKSPTALNLEVLQQDCPSSDEQGKINIDKFRFSAHAVSVPGAAQGYEDLLKRHGSGKFSLSDLLEPAAKLAEEGFPVGPITSYHWCSGIDQIRSWMKADESVPLTVDGTSGPKPGEIFRNADMARILRQLGSKGAKEGFYEGFAGQAIVDAVQKHGGVMTLDDLKDHTSTFPNPISAQYREVNLWQIPPNGQGIAGLIALKGLNSLEQQRKCPDISPGNADSYHAMIEMMRLGFADARQYVCDPNCMNISSDFLLDSDRVEKRACHLFDKTKATIAGTPLPSSCTVSFQVVDGAGNAISFVNSNFMGFGTGIVPHGCGFTLQNRGFGFSVEPGHPNAVAPRKRPYHTIIPGMLTFADTNQLYATISNMGGNMQPQGHVQLTVGMVAGGLDPQAAIDFPRFCIADGTQGGQVHMEGEVEEEVVEELKSRGHDICSGIVGHGRAVFGRAQIIKRDRKTGVLWAGSDGRADGCAIGF